VIPFRYSRVSALSVTLVQAGEIWRRRMDKNKGLDIIDIVKRAKMGKLLDIDDVEEIKDNKKYLRAVKTIYLDILNHASFLSRNFTNIDIDQKRKEIDKNLKILEDKSVEKRNFASEKLMDEYCSQEAEKHIIKLLYSKQGVGIRVYEPRVIGEELLIALKLVMDLDLEEGRKFLILSAALRKKGIIITYQNGHTRYGRDRRKNRDIESTQFKLNDWVIDMLHGHMDIEENIKENISRHRKERKENKIVEKIEPNVKFSDVVLPEEKKDTVKSFIEQNRNNDKFMKDWNMKSITGDRKGINILFSGPSGTGKTMLSKAIANEVEKDLYMVSFSDVVDCYYGNTESNVKKIFDVVEDNSIVLIDEADAILNRRSPAKDSVDKSENRMVNIILQQMEKHSGIIVFTTNIAIGLDRAINRRLDLKMELPTPEVSAREDIWRYHIPEELPIEEDVDVRELAEKYDFTGGQIRNAVLNAGRIAMRAGSEKATKKNFFEACNKESEGLEAMDYVLEGKDDLDVRGYT